jgi:hypothetical protein
MSFEEKAGFPLLVLILFLFQNFKFTHFPHTYILAILEHKTEKFTWKQTLDDVQLSIPVAEGTRGKDVSIEMKTKHLRVTIKGENLIDVTLKILYLNFKNNC